MYCTGRSDLLKMHTLFSELHLTRTEYSNTKLNQENKFSIFSKDHTSDIVYLMFLLNQIKLVT